jgi:paraquat-inducible protein A
LNLDGSTLKACPCCGMVHRLPDLGDGQVARCRRCASVIHSPTRAGLANSRARALALSALLLFPGAVSLPIMRIEQLGSKADASIWSGALGLLRDGELFVGGVVFLCSIVIPLLKLTGILVLTGRRSLLSRRTRAFTYRWIERAGRWGMMDVLLISVVVAWLKMGDMMEVTAGPAAWTFTGCVILSLLASACFDPHALWLRTEPDEPRTTTP